MSRGSNRLQSGLAKCNRFWAAPQQKEVSAHRRYQRNLRVGTRRKLLPNCRNWGRRHCVSASTGSVSDRHPTLPDHWWLDASFVSAAVVAPPAILLLWPLPTPGLPPVPPRPTLAPPPHHSRAHTVELLNEPLAVHATRCNTEPPLAGRPALHTLPGRTALLTGQTRRRGSRGSGKVRGLSARVGDRTSA